MIVLEVLHSHGQFLWVIKAFSQLLLHVIDRLL